MPYRSGMDDLLSEDEMEFLEITFWNNNKWIRSDHGSDMVVKRRFDYGTDDAYRKCILQMIVTEGLM